MNTLRPLFLGIVVGGLGTGLVVSHVVKEQHARKAQMRSQEVAREGWDAFGNEADRLLEGVDAGQRYLCYMKVDENGWFADSINTSLDLEKWKTLISTAEEEIVIPIFPTVYAPTNMDDIYYNEILGSDIEEGDKVLVIGTGSGSDAWVAWLKSRSPIYVIDINPMAIANATATARLGGFKIYPAVGDITTIALPEEFSEFDFVLWNMPYVEEAILEQIAFHDGDDGSILKSFLALLPSLLKKDGKAIVLNTDQAQKFITFPNVIQKADGNVVLYVIPNPKR